MTTLKSFLEGNTDSLSDSAKHELLEMYETKTLKQICKDLGVAYTSNMHGKIRQQLKEPKAPHTSKSGVKLGTKKCMCGKAVSAEYDIINQKRVCKGCVFQTLA